MTLDPFDILRQRIRAGERDSVRYELGHILNADPNNVTAWELLAMVLDDPTHQADCYRRILRIDPGNHHAADKLQALTGQSLATSPQEQSSHQEQPALRCPQCGGAMEVRFVGEMRDKRAVCQYCNTEIDLPDAFRRVRKKRTREQHSRDTLPTQQSRECPNPTCSAVIPQDATQCSWCGADLTFFDEPRKDAH